MTALEAPLRPSIGARASRLLHGCISSPGNIALTLALLLLAGYVLPPLVGWAIVDGHWGTGPEACAPVDGKQKEGACWAFVGARWSQLVYGPYPESEHWRVDAVFALVLAAGVALLSRSVKRKGLIGLALILIAPPVAGVLLAGGVFGLPAVPVSRWGGLMLTVTLAGAALAGSLPLGLAVALCRRSSLPVIRILSVGYIEFLRGVPLVPLLFLVMSILPLLLPPGTDLPLLPRAIVAFILFNSAGMAEVFRGGLQAIPQGQFEAARSIGLSPAKTMALVILPQAVAIVTPGLLNVAVAIVKETTVILIIGLVDFLNQIQAGLADPKWLLGDQVRDSAYLFAGLVYWAVCFGLSRVSARLELQRERRG
ncbi:MAG TPA: amino acid ABC transporter permease [Stellaceae bacterium]|nr:amino acid ABC transporter permease [Stellaceae bacterium]